MNQPVHIKDGVNYSGYNINGGGNDTNFEGTLEAFNALPEEEKAKYKTRDIRGDFNGMPVDEDLDSTSNHPVENQAIAKNIEALVNVYGSKNLLPYPYANGTMVYKGFTFTVYDNGRININGSANTSENVNFILHLTSSGLHNFEGMILSGGVSSNIKLRIMQTDGNVYYDDTGEGVTVGQFTSNEGQIRIIIAQNTPCDSVDIYPMIRDARITDSTYVPYAMSNRELTENIKSKFAITSSTHTVEVWGWINQNIGIIEVSFICQDANSEKVILNLPSGFKIRYQGIVMRGNSNGELVQAWAYDNYITTYLHKGTMAINTYYTASILIAKS